VSLLHHASKVVWVLPLFFACLARALGRGAARTAPAQVRTQRS
jgi:hypothetical protein